MGGESTVFIVDDEEPVARALANVVKLMGLRTEVYSSADAFLRSFDRTRHGCLVLDCKLPGLSGVELQKELKTFGSLLPVIMISGHANTQVVVESMKGGAVNFLEKPFHMSSLQEAIREALDMGAANRREAAERDEATEKIAKLTQKEREVLHLVCQGFTNREIAQDLGLSLRAVEDRRARMTKKLGAESLANLISIRDKAST